MPDPRGSRSLSFPGHSNTGAVIEQRSTGGVRRRIDQQVGRNHPRPDPALAIPWPVAFSVTPPRKLTRPTLAALIHDRTGCARKMLAASTIEDRPANRDHTATTLTPRLPIQGQGEAVMFVFLASGASIFRA